MEAKRGATQDRRPRRPTLVGIDAHAAAQPHRRHLDERAVNLRAEAERVARRLKAALDAHALGALLARLRRFHDIAAESALEELQRLPLLVAERCVGQKLPRARQLRSAGVVRGTLWERRGARSVVGITCHWAAGAERTRRVLAREKHPLVRGPAAHTLSASARKDSIAALVSVSRSTE